MRSVLLALVSCLAFACSGGTDLDAGRSDTSDVFDFGVGDSDAEPDLGTDAAADAGADSGIDAGSDAGTDAGMDSGADAALDAAVDGGGDSGTPDGGTLRGNAAACANVAPGPNATNIARDYEGNEPGPADTSFGAVQLSANGQRLLFQLVDGGDAYTPFAPDPRSSLERRTFVRDLHTEELRVVADQSVPGAISGDGRYVWVLRGGLNAIRRYDWEEDGYDQLVSGPAGAPFDEFVTALATNHDGSKVAFVTQASNVIGGNSAFAQVYLWDAGITTLITEAMTGGPANGNAEQVVISGDGSVVVFASEASDLAPNDTNSASDVFAHVLATGATELLSFGPSGEQQSVAAAYPPAVTHDGRFVAFFAGVWAVPSLAPEGIYIRDRQTGALEAVVDVFGCSFGEEMVDISDDGRFIHVCGYGLYDRDTDLRALVNFDDWAQLSGDGSLVVASRENDVVAFENPVRPSTAVDCGTAPPTGLSNYRLKGSREWPDVFPITSASSTDAVFFVSPRVSPVPGPAVIRYEPAANTTHVLVTGVGYGFFANSIMVGDELFIHSDRQSSFIHGVTGAGRGTAGPLGPVRHVLAWTGTDVHVAGNVSDVVQLHEALDVAANTWRQRSTVGQPPIQQGIVSLWTGTRWLVYGPTASGAFYDPVSDRWAAVTAGGPPANRTQAALHPSGDVFMFDGVTFGRLDSVAGTWTPLNLTGAPSGADPAIRWLADRVLAMTATEVAAYDPLSDTWTALKWGLEDRSSWPMNNLHVVGDELVLVDAGWGRYGPTP